MAYFPYTLHIPYAPQITTKIGPSEFAFVCEIDAELTVEYESAENWEIAGLLFTQSRWNPEFEVTPESDPDLWKVIQRAIDADKDIASRIVEAGEEERAACKEDAADAAYEAYRDRMWEAGR